MFSPVGMKKVMLENYRRSISSGDDIQSMLTKAHLQSSSPTPSASTSISPTPTASSVNPFKRMNSLQSFTSSSNDGDSQNKHRIQRKGIINPIRNHLELQKYLAEDSLTGKIIQKLGTVAMKFDKDRDGILLKSFETNSLSYSTFRNLLKRIFYLDFIDEEFEQLCHLFDLQQLQEINGTEFMIVFVILGNLLRAQKKKLNQQRELRQSQSLGQSQQQQQPQQMKRMTSISEEIATGAGVVDFNFSESDRKSALHKINTAAGKYDRTHHTAKSLKAFEQAHMTPIEFRDSIKGTFDVTVTPKELGALVMHYTTDDENYRVPCKTFVVSFLRYGYEYRLDQRSKQIEETRRAEERLKKQEETKLLRQIESFDATRPDYNYSDKDTQQMLDKIKEAALKYDKNHPSAVSLDGFNSKYLTPGAFRITLYRTFHVELTDKELGSLVHMFDMNNSARSMSPVPTATATAAGTSPSSAAGAEGSGSGAKRLRRGFSSLSVDGGSIDVTEMISTHDFLVHFIRVGYEERSKIRTQHLLHERSLATQQQDEAEKKILRQWKIDNDNFDPSRYRRQDYETAMRKITREAERYHSEHVSAPDLSLFNGSDMNPAEFREMIRRQLNLQLSYEEIAALLPLIGSKTKEKMISTSEFIIKFKAIGWESRQQKRSKQLEVISLRQRRAEEELKKKRDKLVKELNEVVDFNFSEKDRQSAIAKMTQAAHRYDKNHSGSMSLDAFLGRSMEPGVFSRMLKTILHVNLSGKELGAIVTIYDNDGDGQIDSAEFLSNFFFMQRDCRNEVRVKKLERKKQREEEDRKRFMEREILKHSHETMKLKFTPEDEKSLLGKILEVGKKFAIDNASFLEHLKIFKGPAMNSTAFSNTFFRIFLIRLTYAEIGALMCRVNPKMYEINMMDGNAFLTWLQKLGRISEDILLGNITEKTVTLDHFNFCEPPTPSAVVSSASRASFSPQPTGGGLSLPNIRSHRNTSSSPASLFASSPSAEVISSERSVSRGVGGDDSLSSPFRSLSPPRATGSMTSLTSTSLHEPSPDLEREQEEEDPYLRYMTNTFTLSRGKKSRAQPSLPQLYREGSPPPPSGLLGPNSPTSLSASLVSPSSTSSSPVHRLFDGNEGSIISAVTDSSSLMFSPIRPSPDPASSSSSQRQPMVASLLGNNPWAEIDSSAGAAERRRRRGRGDRGEKKISKEMIRQTNQSPPHDPHPSLSSSAP